MGIMAILVIILMISVSVLKIGMIMIIAITNVIVTMVMMMIYLYCLKNLSWVSLIIFLVGVYCADRRFHIHFFYRPGDAYVTPYGMNALFCTFPVFIILRV